MPTIVGDRMRCLTIATLLAGTALSPAARGASGFDAELSPFVGGGTTSGAQITAVSGAAIGLSRSFKMSTSGLNIAPRLECFQSDINTKAVRNGATTLGSYENLVVALGATLSGGLGSFSFAGQRIYSSLMFGRGSSSLALDANRKDSSTVSKYEGISGRYSSFEAGTTVPLQAGLGLIVAAVTSLYQQNQERVSGVFAQDRLNAGGQLSLTQGDQAADPERLPGHVLQRTYVLKIGLSLSI